MSSKISVGDTVRYLNAVGGGTVVRIDGDMAYVDEDGFETPVLVRECVSVGAPMTHTAAPVLAARAAKNNTPSPRVAASPSVQPVAPQPVSVPVVETSGGDVLNITLGFEATSLKALSTSDFDAYLVNDSNYCVYVAVMSRAAESNEWTLRYDGLVEPNIEEYLFTLPQADVPHFDRLCVAYVPFKRHKPFAGIAPASVELKVDVTKFAKLHCFRPHVYFEVPVIAFDIVCDGRASQQHVFEPRVIEQGIMQKAADAPVKPSKPRKAAPRNDEPLEIDLHASELFDNLAGMSPADILNAQIEYFSRVMNENLRNIGRKIVFIHGKGEGVLRQALMKELTHRYKGHDVQDASFREYGFGATQVAIRRVVPTPDKKRPRR